MHLTARPEEHRPLLARKAKSRAEMRLWLFAQVASAEEVGDSEAAPGEARTKNITVEIAAKVPTALATAPEAAESPPTSTVTRALGDD